MRKFASVVVVLMIAAVPLALAGQTAAKGKTTTMTHEMPAELVSMDLAKHMVTLKGQDGQQVSLPVKGEAVATLTSKQVKPGDKVIATCEEDGQGKPTAVTKIRAVTA